MTDVVIIIGSISDRDVAEKASEMFDSFGIKYAGTVASAHRTQVESSGNNRKIPDDGAKVFITIAGLATHLPGVVASHTTKPASGVPVNAALDWSESEGGDNAAILAARIMAVEDRGLAEKLAFHRMELAKKTELEDKRINEQ